MSLFETVALLTTLAALCAYVNEQTLKLPNTIGIMLVGLLLSVVILALSAVQPSLTADWVAAIQGVDFDETVLKGMLSFLLFAGALHVDLNDLMKERWVVGILATFGIVLSTALVGLGTWGLSQVLSLDLPFIYCLVFGALISPTDPIAVLGILKKLGAPKDLETMICGESLFNDGVGVVIFLVLAGIAAGGTEVTAASVGGLFFKEAVGGAIFGLVLGFVGYLLLRSIDNYHVEVLITLAMVTGGYALCTHWHLSGPIAVVVAGLMLGNHGRRLAMSEETRRRLDDFWELTDEILNAVLFLLIGIEVVLLELKAPWLVAGLLAIPLVLTARGIAVGVPIGVMRWGRRFPPRAVSILTWGGLRGGISVALALSLPAVAAREPLVTMTYVVVVFSIAVQGLTVGRLIRSSS